MNEQQQFISTIQMYSAYSRSVNGQKETYEEIVNRILKNNYGLFDLGDFTQEEKDLIEEKLLNKISFGSARFLWIGGTDWLGRNDSNHFAPFNCISMVMNDPKVFGYSMDLGMQGCGVGQVIELDKINQLPIVNNRINLTIVGKAGDKPKEQRIESTQIEITANNIDEKPKHFVAIGDSRKGWVNAYQYIIDLAFKSTKESHTFDVVIDLSNIRPYGEKLHGFGGVANPIYVGSMFSNVAILLNNCVGRNLSTLDVMLILEEAAKNTVSGNIRRVAGMKQGDPADDSFTTAKENLWQCGDDGRWFIDPQRDALRMSNHTRVFHEIPSLETIKESVTKQFYTGEGAIQYAPESIARANYDLLDNDQKKSVFISKYLASKKEASDYLTTLYNRSYPYKISEKELNHRMNRYGLNPCGEVIGSDFRCDLGSVHLSQVGISLTEQLEAFKAAALQVAPLLKLDVDIERFKYSHSVDPIVLVSATQVNQWFINYFGEDWIYWWLDGRPDNHLGMMFKREESIILSRWCRIVESTVKGYCDRHNLKAPNRCTGFKPEGSLSWLSGHPGFSGIHFPPSGSLIYIRRKTFLRDDPIAKAAIDYGYHVIPSADCKDENGHLLDDPFDPRVTSWLLEIPVRESILDKYPQLANVNFNKIPAIAQFDWVMQMQKYYSRHNTSCTINFNQDEIDPLSESIHKSIVNNEGYISMALLARFESNQTFPRLPFEPISQTQYDDMISLIHSRRRQKLNGSYYSFDELVKERIKNSIDFTTGEVACSSEICEVSPDRKPKKFVTF